MPTEPLSARVLDALEAACGRIVGAPDYWHDLGDAHQIRRGDFPPEAPPTDAACVALAPQPSSTTWGELTMTGRTATRTVKIQGWTKGATDDMGARLLAAARLERDLLQAIDAEHADSSSLLYRASAVSIQSDTLDGAQAGLARGRAYVIIIVNLTFHLELGEVA